MIRRALAAATALVLLAVPVAAGAATQDAAPEPAGTATTSLTLASVGIDLPVVGGVPVGDLLDDLDPDAVDLQDIDLGALRSYASTDPDDAMNPLGEGVPFALSSLALPGVGELAARSDGTTTQPGRTVALPEGLGGVTAGRLDAVVADGVATSTVDALSGALTTLVGGLAVGLPSDGARSLVDADAASASNGAVLRDVRLDLTDIVPLEILEELPLEVLVGLVDTLPLELDLSTLTEDVRRIIEGVRDLADLEAAVGDLSAQIGDLEAQVDALEAQLPDLGDAVAAAQALLADAEGVRADVTALDDARAELAAVEGAILDLGDATLATVELICAAVGVLDPRGDLGLQALCDEHVRLTQLITDLEAELGDAADLAVSEAEALVAAAEDAVGAAVEALEEALAEVADLEAALAELLDALDALITEILALVDELLALLPSVDPAELLAALQELIDGLAGLELLRIDEVVVGVTTVASGNGSRATALCDVEGIALLGQDRSVATCAQLQSVLGELDVLLADLLADLPIVGGVAAQGRSFAAVDELAATAVSVGGLTTAVSPDDAQAGDYHRASAAVEALHLEVLPLSLTQVTDGLVAELTALIDGALDELAGLTGVDTAALADLEAELGALLATITTSLPTGEALEGARTAGLSLEALGVGSESAFAAASSSGPIPLPTGPTTPNVGTPTGGAPQTPTPTGNLPTTGGGAAGLALLLLGLGGGAAWAVRGRRD